MLLLPQLHNYSMKAGEKSFDVLTLNFNGTKLILLEEEKKVSKNHFRFIQKQSLVKKEICQEQVF